MKKSTVEQIRTRFDNDVERFANLETGQSATIDAPLSLALIAEAASRVNPKASSLLDVGCGAGNYSLKILEKIPNLNVTLIDLSDPMLKRAVERVGGSTSGKVTPLQGDIRELPIGNSQFDIICAAAVLHHLRETAEWQHVFSKFYAALKPGGSIWISDLIELQIRACNRSCGNVTAPIFRNSKANPIVIMSSATSPKKIHRGR